MQSPAIRDSLLLYPGATQHVVTCVCYDWFDVLVEFKAEANIQLIAQSLRNWEDLTLRSMLNAQVIRPASSSIAVHPPDIWLKHPANVCHLELIRQLKSQFDIKCTTPGSELGCQLLRLQSVDVCRRLLGCTIACGAYGTGVLTSSDARLDHNTTLECGLDASADLTARLLGVAPPLHPRLSVATVAGLGN